MCDDPSQPLLGTAAALPLPTMHEVLEQIKGVPKNIHFKVGGGQHGTEATKKALKEKVYLQNEDHLAFVQTEIYAMGYLEQYSEMKVMHLFWLYVQFL